ncbi:DNA-binding protein [Staphylococcus hyicus]|uniref:DNA-binding protein n=1 Tax=Staphylococcus hyicus TaxID=1284 RepID=A0A418JGQ3_STAHY|nr:phBC6A51 family helix-turn-helix protein [Staphylococcus hyicus]RIO43483.1 DNA-binding protein [Staphylococcus hyicus]
MNMQHGANFYEDYLKLSKKQRQYIELKCETDLTDKEIAKIINIHNTNISKWKNKKKFMDGFAAYHSIYLSTKVPKAIKTLMNSLNARSEKVRLEAAQDIMDRTGHRIDLSKKEIELNGSIQFVDDLGSFDNDGKENNI